MSTCNRTLEYNLTKISPEGWLQLEPSEFFLVSEKVLLIGLRSKTVTVYMSRSLAQSTRTS